MKTNTHGTRLATAPKLIIKPSMYGIFTGEIIKGYMYKDP